MQHQIAGSVIYLRRPCKRLQRRLHVWSWRILWKASHRYRLRRVSLSPGLLENPILAVSNSCPNSTPSETSLVSLSLSLSLWLWSEREFNVREEERWIQFKCETKLIWGGSKWPGPIMTQSKQSRVNWARIQWYLDPVEVGAGESGIVRVNSACLRLGLWFFLCGSVGLFVVKSMDIFGCFANLM